MKKKEITVGNPVAIAGATIIPVVKTSLSYQCIGGMISLIGIKQPVSLIVVTPTSKKAFRITGEEIPLGQLPEVPDLKEILEKLDDNGEGSR
jgi:hypothetical protein